MRTKSAFDARLRQEAKVVYTLLDAADSAGLIAQAAVARQWHEVDARIRAGAGFESEAENLHVLMLALDRTGALAGTWIEPRWRQIFGRLSAAG